MGYGDASCYGSGAIHTVLIIYADQHGHDCLGAYGNFVA